MQKNRFPHRSAFIFVAVVGVTSCCFSCRWNDKVPRTVVRFDDVRDVLTIADWRLIGPFKFDVKELRKPGAIDLPIGLNHDFLTEFGLGEKEVDEKNIVRVRGRSSSNKRAEVPDFLNAPFHFKELRSNLRKVFKTNEEVVAYAASVLESPEDRPVGLIAASDDGMKAWLNNELVINNTNQVGRNIRPFQHNVVIRLRKGKNFLLIKVDQKGFDWGFSLSLCTMRRARDSFVYNIIENPIVRKGESLKIDLSLYETDALARLQILNARKESMREARIISSGDKWNESLQYLEEGLFYCRLILPGTTIERPFYHGDLEAKLPLYRSATEPLRVRGEKIKISIDALLLRYEHLLATGYRETTSVYWQKKMVYIVSELETILNGSDTDGGGFAHCPGTHLRGFRSKIEDQLQYYMIHVPRLTRNRPLPLVVLVPALVEPYLPFLKGHCIANINEIERVASLADKYGYAVVWTSARGNTHGNPIGTTDIMEVMADVRKDYEIDEDKIYLYGDCEGGQGALLLGARFPTLFAAIGVVGPVMTRDIRTTPSQAAAYRKWMAANDVFNFPENLSNIPTLILQKDEDDPGLNEQSGAFIEKCRGLGFSPQWERLRGGHTYYLDDPYEKAFRFFLGRVRTRSPEKIVFSTSQLKYNSAYWITIDELIEPMKKATIRAVVRPHLLVEVETQNVKRYRIASGHLVRNSSDATIKVVTNGRESFSGYPSEGQIAVDVDNSISASGASEKNNQIEGPVLHAFAEPFILVEGSGGRPLARATIEAVRDKIKKVWVKDYFVECKHKLDVQISRTDITNNNLILLGDARTNSLVERVKDRLPVKASADHIILGENRYNGNSLGYIFVYPNPLNPKRYVVVIGSNDMENFRWEAENLAMTAWYDFLVWDSSNGAKTVKISEGFFNSDWKIAGN
jgi:hypothetical protein